MADALDVEQTSVGLEADLRSAGRLRSRLPMPKSRVLLMVVSVRSARPSLWYCLMRDVLVVDVQRRDDAVGDDAGAEAPRGAAGDAARSKIKLHLVGAADVEVLADHFLEEDAARSPAGPAPG